MIAPSVGWRLWLCGNSAYTSSDGKTRPILPYRKIRPSRVPTRKQNRKLVTSWRPLFCMMEKGLEKKEYDIPTDVTLITDDMITESYRVGMDYVKTVASYIWIKKNQIVIDSYAIGYWCKMVGAAEIKKNGSDSDKDMLELEERESGRKKRQKYKHL